MQQKLTWQGYFSDDRNKIIEEIKEAIFKGDGYIMNFNIFSDIALSLSIEIEEKGIQELHEALSSILNVSDIDMKNIDISSRKEWLVFLHISFGSGKGELKKEIPAVPG